MLFFSYYADMIDIFGGTSALGNTLFVFKKFYYSRMVSQLKEKVEIKQNTK